MKPIKLTAIVKIKDGDNDVKIEERPVLLNPTQIACVNRDKIKPFGEDKKQGTIPIIGSGFSNEPIDCQRVTMTTKDVFAVKETVEEIEALWTDALSTSAPIPVEALAASPSTAFPPTRPE